jgi:predicted SAM-dependent methyltransferase
MKQGFKTNKPDLVRLFRLANYEINNLVADWSGRLSMRQQLLLRRLRQSSGLKLNIAGGRTTKPGWINIDVSDVADNRMDLRRRFPIPAGSARYIFCEHFCDHLNFPDGISAFLSECYRVLERDGIARFVLHDAEGLVKAYLQRDSRYFEVAEMTSPTMMQAVNFLFRFNDFHQFFYDFETFERVLGQAGFSRVKRHKYLESENPEIVLDYVLPSREVMSMYVEAQK